VVPLGEKIHTAFGCNMDVRTRMLRKQHDIQHRDYKCAHPHARTCTRGDSAQGDRPVGPACREAGGNLVHPSWPAHDQ